MDAPTEEPWGLRIERVEIKDIALPESMMRSMSKQAEAERERRARVIAADGEFQASQRLTDAAATMADTPGALQLRLLQTVVDVAAEKNSTLVMPFPVELLRFFEARTGQRTDGGSAVEPAATAPTDPDRPTPRAPDRRARGHRRRDRRSLRPGRARRPGHPERVSRPGVVVPTARDDDP